MRYLTAVAALGFLLAVTGTAGANTKTLVYEFTGADLFNRQYVDGADASTAADNALFDGGRLLRVGTDGNHANAGRTYVESQQSNFDTRWTTYANDGYVFDAFNLWGLNGRGVHWGEDFKPLEWVAHTGPDGWVTGHYDWPWGTPPAGAHTTLFPYWYADDPADAISMTATQAELEALKFSVTAKFDLDDAWWGQDTQGAPNALGLGEDLTFWFGGWLTQYDAEGDIVDKHLYEGNMVQTAVPEPVTMAGLMLGVGSLVGYVRRRRK